MNISQIDRAALEDLPRLAELLAAAFEEADLDTSPCKAQHGLRLLLENPARGRILVLREAEKIVAMATLLFTVSTAEGGLAVLLEELIVDKEYRHRGYGTALLQHAIDFTREKGLHRITLLFDARNTASKEFFEKAGFVGSSMIPLHLTLSGVL
jgi:GNAT superfamily N-acetyltransferase